MRLERIAVVAALLICASASADPVQDGITYLLSKQSSDGTFGATTQEDPLVATHEAITALNALGLGSGAEAQSAQLGLAALTPAADVELEQRREMALFGSSFSLPFNPSTLDAVGFEVETPSSLSWSLLTDRTQGGTLSTTGYAKALRLAALAQTNGCFATVDDETTADVTATALMAMRQANSHPAVAAARSAALSCLLGMQDAGGSFGSTSTTALALLAIAESAGDHTTAITQAKSYLLAQQQNGGWGDVRATALALRGLAAAGAAGVTEPDWVVKQDATGAALLTVLNPFPQVGQPLAVIVSVSNQSSVPAPAVTVRFRAVPVGGGASITLGQDTIPPLAPGQSVDWDTTTPTTGLFGKYTIYADVNPDHLNPEIDFTNNEAVGLADIEGGVDLAVSTQSLVLTPLSSTSAQVQATVVNYGAPTTTAAVVNVYQGTVGSSFVIGSATLPAGFGSNGAFSFSFTWNTSTLNGPTSVWIVADVGNAIVETNESNNTSFRIYDPSSTSPVDLSVASATAPPPVIAGKTFTLQAVLQNNSNADANRVPVALVNEAGGATMSVVEVPFIPANGTAPVTLTGATVVGQSGFFADVIVDPDRVTGDPNPFNNKFTVFVTVNNSGPVELSISQLRSSPTFPQPGESFSVSAVVANNGPERAVTAVRLTDEIQAAVSNTVPVAVPPPGAGFSTAVTVNLGTFTMPNHNLSLRACVDPFNTSTEVNENDNCTELELGASTGGMLTLRSRDMKATPAGADIGEPVTLSANVRNFGTGTAGGVLEFWLGRPDGPEGQLLGTRAFSVDAGTWTPVSMPWIRGDGAAEFYGRVTRVNTREPLSGVDTTSSPPSNIAPTNFKIAGRHLFLEEIQVNTSLPFPYGDILPKYVASGRLTGAAAPELVVAYDKPSFFTQFAPSLGSVEVLEETPTGHQLLWRDERPNYVVRDLSLVDTDNDGVPEVLVTYNRVDALEMSWRAYEPNGTLKWERNVPGTQGFILSIPFEHTTTALADWNHDGVVDLVGLHEGILVLSGDDGRILAQHAGDFDPNAPSGQTDRYLNVMDVFGDGQLEVLTFKYTGSPSILVAQDGGTIWQDVPLAANPAYETPIADINGDGQPDLIAAAGPGVATMFALATGATETHTAETVSYVTAIGALRQNGLRYPVAAQFDAYNSLAAYRPDLTMLWQTPGSIGPTVHTLADVLGLGRPQYIGVNGFAAPYIADGRTGSLKLPLPLPWGQGGGGTSPAFGYPTPAQEPLVADLKGNATSCIAQAGSGLESAGYNGVGIEYGNSEVLVFCSPHWKKMPTAFPQREMVKGRIGEDLKFNFNSADAYRWWTTHNTYNQQFDVEPEHLLPDFTVAATYNQGPATAGQPFALTATLNNVGGLPASNVPVRFYDGDPNDGGVPIGTSTVAGPLAIRTGTSPVSFTWQQPWPEGIHSIYVVANPDSTIEESGHEDNTAQFNLNVHAATSFCDLSINPSTLSASAALPGQPQTYTATVSNVGTVACPAVALTVYDGPSGNAVLQGNTSIPALAPSTQVQATVTADAIASTNVIRFVVDEAQVAFDPNQLNNQAVLSVNNGAATKPDLRVALLSANPASPYPGEPTVLSATVLNAGTPSTPTDVTFTWGGVTVAMPVGGLANSATSTVTVTLPAPATSAVATATVDTTHAVDEYDENNNTATLAITDSVPSLSAVVTATPASAATGSTISISVALGNTGAVAQNVAIAVDVLDSSGTVVANISGASTIVPVGGTTLSTSWATGTTVPGSYTLRASVTAGGRLDATGTTAVTLSEAMQASALLAVTQGTYHPTETVPFNARVSNTSHAVPLGGAVAVLTLNEPGTGNVLYTSERTIPTLAPGAHFDFLDAYAVSVAAKLGIDVAHLDVLVPGNDLASTATSFVVAPSQTKTVKVTTTTGSPLINIGQTFTATVNVQNLGSTAVSNSQLTVLLFESGGTSLTQLAMQTQVVNLSAGASNNYTFNFATTGLNAGPKLLVTQLDSQTRNTLLLDAQPVTDHEPPIITVTGVFDNEVTNQNVTPVITITDASAFTSTITLDGPTFVSGTTVSTESPDPHVLLVTAEDEFGNSASLTISFTIDKTPPVITYAGVTDGDILNTPVTLTFSAADPGHDVNPSAHAVTVTSTIDGVTFPTGDTVSTEGDHTWAITATDSAGNTATTTVIFTLDLTPPVVNVSGVTDGAFYSSPVTPTFSATDLPNGTRSHLDTVTGTLDGVAFASDTTITSAGQHTLEVIAKDIAGNSSPPVTVVFTLDFTPPVVTVSGVANNGVYNSAVTPVITVTEDAYDQNPTVDASLDGVRFISGTTVSAAGTHTLVVTATNQANLATTVTVNFTLDYSVPCITIGGVTDGTYYNHSVTPTFSACSTVTSITATLNLANFTSGNTVSTAGSYTLVVTATNAAGSSAQQTVHFTLDFTAPNITVTGVTNGASGSSFTISFSASDSSPTTTTATLDGVTFTSGSTVNTAGSHTLVVNATDAASNQATAVTINFTVTAQMTPPFNYAACALGNLKVLNHASVAAPSGQVASVATNGSFTMSGNTTISGDSVSGGATALSNSAFLAGTAYHGGTFSQLNSSHVGGQQSVSPAPLPCECGYDVTARLDDAQASNDDSQLSGNSAYQNGALDVSSGTVTLGSGRYYFTSLRVRANATLTTLAGANVQIFVRGNVTVENNSFFGASTTSPPITLVSGASSATGGSVQILEHADVALNVYAPNADVTLQNNITLVGAVVGNNITLNNNQKLKWSGPQSVPPPLTCP